MDHSRGKRGSRLNRAFENQDWHAGSRDLAQEIGQLRTPHLVLSRQSSVNKKYIALFQVPGAKPLPEYRRDPSADLRVNGLNQFAFQVADTHAAVKELKAKGAEVAMGPVDSTGVVFAFARDNAGNCFELIQFKNQKQ